MTTQIYNALLAVALGAVVCVALFVPFVAMSYRRRGRLTWGRALLWIAAAVYGWAIWTYTLIPLPQSDDFDCVGVNLNPLAFIDDINAALATGSPLTSMFLLQLVFNIALFVPLGFFLRVLGGRGILVAGLAGLGISLLIELTQVTGVWGLYHCAYRVFDVVDLMSNTLGALVGSVVALMVPVRIRTGAASTPADAPRPVTRGRRLLAMLCDAAGFWMVSVSVTVGVALVYSALAGVTTVGEWPAAVGTITAVVIWSAVTLATGQSVGDFAVMLRYVDARVPLVFARVLRLCRWRRRMDRCGLRAAHRRSTANRVRPRRRCADLPDPRFSRSSGAHFDATPDRRTKPSRLVSGSGTCGFVVPEPAVQWVAVPSP